MIKLTQKENKKFSSWQECDNVPQMNFLSDRVPTDQILFAAQRSKVGGN